MQAVLEEAGFDCTIVAEDSVFELVDAVGVMGGATKLRRYCEFLRRARLSIHKEILDAIETHYGEGDYELHDVSAQAEKLTMPLYYAHGKTDGIMPVAEMSCTSPGTAATRKVIRQS